MGAWYPSCRENTPRTCSAALAGRMSPMSNPSANVSPATDPGDRLSARLSAAAAPICVGLDPVAERMPEVFRCFAPLEAIGAFCEGVLDGLNGLVPCIKFQSACFERYGASGVSLLERVIHIANDRGYEIILDGKRGDIGISAEHYAAASVATGAHWVTVNGYLGEDGIRPFLEAGLGVFALVRTSNPSANDLQSTRLEDGGTIAGRVARMVSALGSEWRGSSGMSALGAVVGANKVDDAETLRDLMPDQPFLLPGYGAQGGGADGVRAAMRPDGSGVLVTASRSVIYAEPVEQESWIDAIRRAAEEFSADIAAVSDGGDA